MNNISDEEREELYHDIRCLVSEAYNSIKVDDDEYITLENMLKKFNSVAHPRVKEGVMSPTEAVVKLRSLFWKSAQEKNGVVTLDEFNKYHEKLYMEAMYENVQDVYGFVKNTITELWRMGELLKPTNIRPCFDINTQPKAYYANTLMTLVWPLLDDKNEVIELNGVKQAVRPIFARGEIPKELQGYFAFEEELSEMKVEYKKPQIAIQRWLDFVWKGNDDLYYGIPSIISARVDLEMLPHNLRQLIMEHNDALKMKIQYIHVSTTSNPTYKLTSHNYGIDSASECKKINELKVKTYAGKQYGQLYHGRVNGQFCKYKGIRENNTATGINM